MHIYIEILGALIIKLTRPPAVAPARLQWGGGRERVPSLCIVLGSLKV